MTKFQKQILSESPWYAVALALEFGHKASTQGLSLQQAHSRLFAILTEKKS